MIIFMGVTGAGKSIQGQLLADELGIPWVSTGELLRAEAADNPHPEMMDGKLLGDQEMIELVDRALSELKSDNNECVLDGFPRTKVQADWLISQVKSGRLHLQAVINLKVSEKVVRSRLQSRGRADDTETAIRQRFLGYQQETMPLFEDFRASGMTVLEIDGEQTVEEVHDAIQRILG